MNNDVLTICIPTYNRAELLNITLSNLIEVIHEFQCEIIVSDNASIDNTKEIVNIHKKCYRKLKYIRQFNNVGYDRNVATCYENSTSKYIWILGDSKKITKENFRFLYDNLKQEIYQAIVINSENRIKNIPTKVFDNASILLADIGWHITLLCSTIISKDFINKQIINRYYDTDFIHFGVFFENIVKYEKLNILWVNDNIVYSTNHDLDSKIFKSNNWNLLEVFAVKWFTIVMSLPNQIELFSKLKCIKDHDKNINIFTFRQLIALRARQKINKFDLNKNKNIVPFITNLSIMKIRLAFIIPYPILEFTLLVYDKLKCLK
ncbi:MAG: glycosyltransferase family 2 protein [Atribacterota bacterium]|nr:glycosyltransferase family 2 protein [Atribacterota bacterium]